MHLLSALASVEGWAVTATAASVALLAELDRQIPTLVVLALMLPDINGLGLYRILRHRPTTRQVPILFVTGACTAVERARLAGPHACIKAWPERELLIARAAALLGEVPPAR